MFPTRLEIIPSEGIVEKVTAAVPLGTTLTITCLPHHGIERTMRVAVQLAGLGYTVVPHLAARALQDRPQLVGILRDCDAAGIREVFAIGGDSTRAAGPYGPPGGLMEDIAQYSGGGMRAGSPATPRATPPSAPSTCWTHCWPSSTWRRTSSRRCASPPRRSLTTWGCCAAKACELPVWAGRRRCRAANQAGRPGHPDRRRRLPEIPQPQGPAGPPAPERGTVLAAKPGVRAAESTRQDRRHPLLHFQPPDRGNRRADSASPSSTPTRINSRSST